jgi:hypothetical protein
VTVSPFPSWSWVGWVGAVELDSPLEYENAGLKFYKVLSDGRLSHIKQRSVTPRFESYLLSIGRSLPDYSWRNDQRMTIEPSDLPATLSDGISSAIVAFWTSTAVLDVKHDQVEYCGIMAPQILAHGEDIEVEWRQKPQFDTTRLEERCKFAIIGRHYLEGPGDGYQLAVLMVSDGEDGLVRRRGLLVMNETDWNALENRQWEKVFLR